MPVETEAAPDASWKTSLLGACCAEPAFCAFSVVPVTAPFAVYFLRKQALGEDLSTYQCFQGQGGCCCAALGGRCGEAACPGLCLAVESTLCCPCATQATRAHVMHTLSVRPDPCDQTLMHLHGCLQCAGCLTWCAGRLAGSSTVASSGSAITLVADCLYWSLVGCMAAQVKHELWARGAANQSSTAGAAPPAVKIMIRP